MNTDRSYKEILKDGREILVLHPEIGLDPRGDTCDLILCPWCNQKAFVTLRRRWRIHVYGNPAKAVPSCGCNRGFKPQCDWASVGDDIRSGMPYGDIARKHGITYSSVHRIRRKLGIPNRK